MLYFRSRFFDVFPTSTWSIHMLYFLYYYFGKIILYFLSYKLDKKGVASSFIDGL